MHYIIVSVILIGLVASLCVYLFREKRVSWGIIPISMIVILLLDILVIQVDSSMQTSCTEIWSGQIIEVNHEEEWDEWIPEKGHRDEDGNYIVDEPAHWEHHNATNKIKTTDDGWVSVRKTLEGIKFTDSFVNSDEELKQYYPIGMPTASTHTYKNKVQAAASSSLYKHNDINVKDYNLPSYPLNKNKYLSIDRIIGEIPNKEESLKVLDKYNTLLNDTNNPNNLDGTKSYKQVNLIFVNLGDVTDDYGFALEEYWKGGNKNDFIVAFGSRDNKVTWCYPITWSEVEILKSEVRDYMLENSDLNDFPTVIENVSKTVEDKFKRKEFADFDYLQIEPRTRALIVLGVLNILFSIFIFAISSCWDEIENKKYYRRSRW